MCTLLCTDTIMQPDIIFLYIALDGMVQEENRDKMYTRLIQQQYPTHLEAQKLKTIRDTNTELKRMEKQDAERQFRSNYGRRLTQR